MDPLPNTDPLPVPPEHPGGLIGWLKLNAFNLFLGLTVAVVILRYLNPLDVVLAAAGLTAIIFIHELGHFAAAKLCNVRVETFSIGFGPALPFCSTKYGETTYKLAMVPLGGYVKMLGEGDAAGDEDADDDPRSFKNQSVGERMLIISAGVVMNILLGCVLFVVVYMHGLEEKPAVIASLEPAGAAWRAGLHSGTQIEQIGTREHPLFDDIRPIIWATQKGEQLLLKVDYKGKTEELKVEPLQEEGSAFPVLGVRPPEKPVLVHFKRSDDPPYRTDTPAALATASGGGPGFRSGDRVVGMTDPDDPARAVTPLTPKPADPPGEIYVLYKRMARLAGEPVTLHILREGEPADGPPTAVTVAPAYRKSVGLRMRMGDVVATRRNSPAQGPTPVQPGDQITEVEVREGTGDVRVWTADQKAAAAPAGGKRTVAALDPLRLPGELNRWANRTPGPKTVKLTVLRDAEHTRKPVTLELGWDDVGQFDQAPPSGANSPLPVNGLGLAYQVQAVVDHVAEKGPAAAAEVQPNDRVVAVRFRVKDHAGKVVPGTWEEIKPTQWAFVDFILQRQAPYEVELRVDRNGQTRELALTAADDADSPADDRGLVFEEETVVVRADGVGDALEMGARRTVRSIQSIYINLYAMAFGRVSFVKTVSGPITLARASYIIAGEDFWKLLLLLALISINLAVVNFLPIPVLDGGHMMFLLYEAVRGKPAPESVQTILTFVGLGLILLLMVTVIGLDLYRLVVMIFR